MVEAPERLFKPFAAAGASHLTVHVETCPEPSKTLDQIRTLGCKAGITLKPGTHVGAVDAALPAADLVLLMSVEPGLAGQAFMPEAEARAIEIRRKLDALRSEAWLAVDGGMTPSTAKRMRAAGVDVFVAASAVFSTKAGISAAIQSLRLGVEVGA
jgi:ribulose-phosphate 3-epimerase